MKLHIIRFTAFSIFIFISIFFIASRAYAGVVPKIDGYVKNAQTGAPISGVWVKWTSGNCSPGSCRCAGANTFPSSSRYVKTNNAGHYVFPNWQDSLAPGYFQWNSPISEWGSDWNTKADIDLDGIESSDPFIQPSVNCVDANPAHIEAGDFGCGANPHQFTVVLPSGWTGSFDTISGIAFANDTADFDLPTIFYHPPSSPPENCESPIRPNHQCVSNGPQGCPAGYISDTLYACPANTTCCGKEEEVTPTIAPSPTSDPGQNFKVSGKVFVDLDTDGIMDPGEPPYIQGLSITIYDVAKISNTYRITDSSGNYSAVNLPAGSYDVYGFAPGGNRLTTPSKTRVTLGPDKIVNFGISSTYTVTGRVYVDMNKNKQRDPGEPNYNNPIAITSPGGFSQTFTNASTYLISYNSAGTYTISLSSPLTAGFIMVHPLNGPPASFTVTVGEGCKTNNQYSGLCDVSGNISDLDFAVTDSVPWIQGVGINMRFDNGITNYIAGAPACSGSYTSISGLSSPAGIIFTGDKKPQFGKGSASQTDWVVGGVNYPEIYNPPGPRLPTSYTFILSSVNKSGINITNLSNVCDLDDCTLPNTLSSGVYKANNDVRLHNYNFKSNNNFVFLINGTLTLTGTIDVPYTSTAMFTASENIIIDKSVGLNNYSCNSLPNLEGFFSADKNVTVEGINDCTVSADRMLTIEGAMFVNAELSGGVFKNERDLCSNNYSFPSIIFRARNDFILNAPNLFRIKNFNYQEEAN